MKKKNQKRQPKFEVRSLKPDTRELDESQYEEITRVFEHLRDTGGNMNDFETLGEALLDCSLPTRRKLAALDAQNAWAVIAAAMTGVMRNAGFVYIIEAVGTGRVKIGRATDVFKRIESLQTSSPFPLKLRAAWSNGDPQLEQKLHARFAKERVQGEWFEIPPELAAMIEANSCDPEKRR
jgi:hypothetical protein